MMSDVIVLHPVTLSVTRDGQRGAEDVLPLPLPDIPLWNDPADQLHHSVDTVQCPVQSGELQMLMFPTKMSTQEGVGVVSLVEGGLKISGQTHLLDSLYANRCSLLCDTFTNIIHSLYVMGAKYFYPK